MVIIGKRTSFPYTDGSPVRSGGVKSIQRKMCHRWAGDCRCAWICNRALSSAAKVADLEENF